LNEGKRREVIELDGAKRWKNTFVVYGNKKYRKRQKKREKERERVAKAW
jgi:hypothetical protein